MISVLCPHKPPDEGNKAPTIALLCSWLYRFLHRLLHIIYQAMLIQQLIFCQSQTNCCHQQASRTYISILWPCSWDANNDEQFYRLQPSPAMYPSLADAYIYKLTDITGHKSDSRHQEGLYNLLLNRYIKINVMNKIHETAAWMYRTYSRLCIYVHNT